MRLSTKGKYALEALVLLGYKIENDPIISLHIISAETKISEGYLEQLFRMLKKENIVSSKKGKNGGYYFEASLDKISVGDILRAVEGSLAPVKCVDNKHCNRKSECFTYDLWEIAYDNINSLIDHISLQSLVSDYTLRQKKVKSERISDR